MAKKSNYWQERFTEEEERLNKDARAYSKRIEQQYDMALRNIERDINDWYMRIAKNNNVSLLEAKRMLSARELAEFKWNVKEYIKAGETNAISPIWMKELENASARVHISRLEALKIQIQNEVEGIYGVRDKEMQNYLIRTYGETYYHTAYEIQKGNGVGWSLNRLDTNKVNTIIHKPWAVDGKNFSDRIWEDKTKLINSLHTGLTQSFIRGEAPDKLISSIAKEFNIKKSTAARLVMTESAAYSSKARQDSFKRLNLSKYEIVATLDSKTSEICQEMDGKVFDMKDYQVGVTAPPFHVWCRTTTAPWFPENYDAERIARGIDGKTYKVPGDMKYKDWKEKYIQDPEKYGIMEENYRTFSDVKVWKKYISKEEKEFLETLNTDEQRVIRDYTGSGAGRVNEFLRSREEEMAEIFGVSDKFSFNQNKKDVENLRNAIAKFELKESIVTYRAQNIKDAFEKVEDLKTLIGTEYVDRGFMSTTPIYKVVDEYADSNCKNMIFEIKLKKGKGKGAYINELSGFKNQEYEFLIRDNTKFTITDVYEDDGYTKIRMVEKDE